MSDLKIGSLFSGYCGLDMAVESVTGAQTAWVSDIDKGACKILAHRYPNIPNLGDLTQIDWDIVEPVDIITGGFPCQDLSHAGKRAGMADGTRSGLWSYMCEAINVIRPRLVVAENVRGLLSAEALRPVEPCAWCVGDEPEFDVRALGAVLADLADIGYDAQWVGLRAADVGACHGRFRVFLIAYPQRGGLDGWSREPIRRPLERAATSWPGSTVLLPTPRSSDTNGTGAHGAGGLDLRTTIALLPTPTETFDLLPTPVAQPSGNTPEDHLRKKPGREVVTDLAVLVENGLLATGGKLPTKETRHAISAEGRPDQELPDVRGDADPQAVQERPIGGPDGVPEARSLLSDLREQPRVGAGGYASVAGTTDQAEDGLRDLPGSGAAARPSRRQGRDEQRPVEPGGAVPLVSPETSLAARSGRSRGVDFGPYEAAIQQWEAILGREAPAPTEPTGRRGAHRLSPLFTEFLMGLPAGWITDVPGIARNEALKACGNGVVPQQAAAALRHMLTVSEVAA